MGVQRGPDQVDHGAYGLPDEFGDRLVVHEGSLWIESVVRAEPEQEDVTQKFGMVPHFGSRFSRCGRI